MRHLSTKASTECVREQMTWDESLVGSAGSNSLKYQETTCRAAGSAGEVEGDLNPQVSHCPSPRNATPDLVTLRK